MKKYRGWEIRVSASPYGFFASGRGGKLVKTYSAYKDRNSLYEENNKITRELAKISSDKRMSQKDKDKNNQTLYQSFTDLRNEKITPLEEKIKEVEVVSFGGQTFNLHDFVYKRESDNQMDYCMPNISTLNEYFSSIEQNLSNTKKLKF